MTNINDEWLKPGQEIPESKLVYLDDLKTEDNIRFGNNINKILKILVEWEARNASEAIKFQPDEEIIKTKGDML